jgi:hypothetical protein
LLSSPAAQFFPLFIPDLTVRTVNDQFSLNVIWIGLIIRKEERKSLYKTLVGNSYKKSLRGLGLKGKKLLKDAYLSLASNELQM